VFFPFLRTIDKPLVHNTTINILLLDPPIHPESHWPHTMALALPMPTTSADPIEEGLHAWRNAYSVWQTNMENAW
jgi:hypothetical protein